MASLGAHRAKFAFAWLLLQGANGDLTAQNFIRYFNYNGNLQVGGSVTISSTGTSHTVSFTLTNVDAGCENGPSGQANSCGVHIHEGTSCQVNAQGHYYKTPVTTDPWTSVVYQTARGTATVDNGATEADNTGKTFIVHDKTGARVACAILRAGGTGNEGAGSSLRALNFQPYFNYNGNLQVGGSISTITTAGTSQTFTYSLTGVDDTCTTPSNAANSCGIHIHQGTSCTEDARGHYYTGTVTADPWTTVVYTATGTTASGSETVATGATNDEVRGKTFIIHNRAGGRVACAVITAAPAADTGPQTSAPVTAQNFVPYFDYEGKLRPTGAVTTTTTGTSQTLQYTLYGLDPKCADGVGEKANSCGVHIHAGTTCTANAQGHYYGGSVTADPWKTVVYLPSADGVASSSVTVATGYSDTQIQGKTIIIHDWTGARIACAVIGAPTNVPAPGQALKLNASEGVGIGSAGGFFFGLLFGVFLVFCALGCRKAQMDKKKLPPGKLDAMIDKMIHPKAAKSDYDSVMAAPPPQMSSAPPSAPPKKSVAPKKEAAEPKDAKQPLRSSESDVSMDVVKKASDTRGSTMAKPAPPPEEPENGLPSGWKEIPDEETGKNYYYNTKTGESKWTKPTAEDAV